MHNSENAKRVVEITREWLGTPYLHQASGKRLGCDCLGLVRGVWREVEGSEPEAPPAYSSVWTDLSGAEQLIAAGQRHFVSMEISDVAIGDVLVFRLRSRSAAKHVGIKSTEHAFIHAYQDSAVVETALDQFWRRRIAAAFRFPSIAKEGIA